METLMNKKTLFGISVVMLTALFFFADARANEIKILPESHDEIILAQGEDEDIVIEDEGEIVEEPTSTEDGMDE
jgi:hypothetical protein